MEFVVNIIKFIFFAGYEYKKQEDIINKLNENQNNKEQINEKIILNEHQNNKEQINEKIVLNEDDIEFLR
jgi:hypothetical protein